jgi:hypothetical protein
MSNIKVGDLVMVVKPAPCCGNESFMGKVFFVTGNYIKKNGSCRYCSHFYQEAKVVAGVFGDVGEMFIERVIKIDPLSEPESITKDEEVPA